MTRRQMAVFGLSALGAQAKGELPELPTGLGGHFVGVHHGCLVVAGGSTWTKPKADGGEKRWLNAVHILRPGGGQWEQLGDLPQELAYGGCASFSDGVYLFGGQSRTAISQAILKLSMQYGRLRTETVGELPSGWTNGGSAQTQSEVFLFGGQNTMNGPAQSLLWHWRDRKCGVLAPCPSRGVILPVVFSLGSGVDVLSGAELLRPAINERRYSKARWQYTSQKGWEQRPDLPHAVVAAPALVTLKKRRLLFSGDDGRLGETNTIGFGREVVDVTNGWSVIGSVSSGLVTTGAVLWQGRIVIPGGEAMPGTRSRKVVTYEEL